jgi:hypothetical protein
MKKKFKSGSWEVIYSPEDGARIDRLAFAAKDLLTAEPLSFSPPSTDYGEYENRPVYAYDDCFPSVNSCIYPGLDWQIPDHGELCWLSWEVTENPDCLIFSVRSKILPILFKREMHFNESGIDWSFKVVNEGDSDLPFQHVMHPLFPLDQITAVEFPPFESVYDEIEKRKIDLEDPKSVRDFLLHQPVGSTKMLFLNNIKTGNMSWSYRNGITIEATFSESDFPTIGIWWNNNGYPDEDGCRRNECAFEPIPGNNSTLIDAIKDGNCLSVLSGEIYSWQIQWKIKQSH